MGAHLGAHRPLLRQDHLRSGRAVAQPPVPQRQGRGWYIHEGRAELELGSAGGGHHRDRGRLARALPSTSGPERCTGSRRSRTRRSSRSRRPRSTTSCASRTATAEVAGNRVSPLAPPQGTRIRAVWLRGARPAPPRNLHMVVALSTVLGTEEAAGRTGWSPRMLRYLEQVGLVVPAADRRRVPALRDPRAQPAPLAAGARGPVRRRAR